MTDDLKARGVPHQIWAFGSRYTRNRTLGAAFAGREYILATALSDLPSVKALVAEAEARGMERAARLLDKRSESLVADHGSHEWDTDRCRELAAARAQIEALVVASRNASETWRRHGGISTGQMDDIAAALAALPAKEGE